MCRSSLSIFRGWEHLPNWSESTEFHRPALCLQTNAPAIRLSGRTRHLQAMPREISGIVVVTSYEEVWQWNIPPSQSAETGELVGLVWWGCQPSGDQSGADVPSPGTHISASMTWSQFLRRIVAESRIPSWMLALHGPMVSLAPWCCRAPKAASIRVSRPDSFIKWPMQPHTFCTLCITPGRKMRFWNIS